MPFFLIYYQLEKSLNNTLKHNVNIKLILYPFKDFIKRQPASFLFLHKIKLRNTFNNMKKCQIQHIPCPISIHLYNFLRMFRLKIYSDIKVPLYARIIHQRREISEFHNFLPLLLLLLILIRMMNVMQSTFKFQKCFTLLIKFTIFSLSFMIFDFLNIQKNKDLRKKFVRKILEKI